MKWYAEDSPLWWPSARIWKENESERASLYFEDPNGHRLEVHVGDLGSRLADARQNPWPDLEILDRGL